MHARNTTAHVRLALLAAVGLLLAFLACRPAWSPDGRKLLFHTRSGERLGIALYDRDTGKAETIFASAKQTFVAPLWTADGKHAVLVCSERQSKAWWVVVRPIAGDAPPVTFALDFQGDPGESLVVPPVVVGNSLFLAVDGIRRIDLATGKVTGHIPAEAGEQYFVAPAGKGLGYVKIGKGREEERPWEIGRLDPATMRPSPLLRDTPELGWKVHPMPAFSPDGSRIALPAYDEAGPKAAILVFANGKLETTLPVDGDAQLGSVAWAADNVTIYASGCRRDREAKRCHWFLLETTIAGSVVREIPVFDTPDLWNDTNQVGLAFQHALAPDGKTVALSTAMLDRVESPVEGLYLVDVAKKQRTVTRVPFPAVPQPLTLAGSDTMLALAGAWVAGYASAPQGEPVDVVGGGTGIGFRTLLDGKCDLAMATRPAKPAELAAAQQRGLALVEHRLARSALAICVPKDNPLAAITMEQLDEVFGERGKTQWSELGVQMPAGLEAITPVGLADGAGTLEKFRELVLGQGGRFAQQAVQRRTADEVRNYLLQNGGSIGFLGFGSVDERLKVVPVAAEAAGKAVLPTPATIADGSYPLCRTMFLYTLGEPKPPVAAFLRWLASEPGQAVTRGAGYLPAR